MGRCAGHQAREAKQGRQWNRGSHRNLPRYAAPVIGATRCKS
jgi:hypothetical protein